MTRKVPLTLDDHRLIAAILYTVSDKTSCLYADLGRLLGKSHRAAVRAEKAVKKLAETRSALETIFRRTLFDVFDGHLYYPGNPAPHTELNDCGEIYRALQECEHGVQDVLRRLWRALPVQSFAVKSLERARNALAAARSPLFGR